MGLEESLDRACLNFLVEDENQASIGVVPDAELFYMKQTIGNACGTIAVLHSIGNNLHSLSPGEGYYCAHDRHLPCMLAIDAGEPWAPPNSEYRGPAVIALYENLNTVAS